METVKKAATLTRIPGRSVLAIDPGTFKSAWIRVLPDGTPGLFDHEDNDKVLDRLRQMSERGAQILAVIEKVEPYGNTGTELLETVQWIGRFMEAARGMAGVGLVTRREVKTTLCGTTKVNDAGVRDAVMQRYGGSAAKGTKAAPGPLYGLRADIWQALAVALAYLDRPADEIEEMF